MRKFSGKNGINEQNPLRNGQQETREKFYLFHFLSDLSTKRL